MAGNQGTSEMIDITCELRNNKEVLDALKTLPREISIRVLKGATNRGAKRVAEAFARNLPVQYGFARDTARTRLGEKGETSNAVSYYVGTGAFYVHMLEWGTKTGIEARHDLMDAFNAEAKNAVEEIQKELAAMTQRALRKHFGRIK